MKRRRAAAASAGILGCWLALATTVTGSAAAQEPCPQLRELAQLGPSAAEQRLIGAVCGHDSSARLVLTAEWPEITIRGDILSTLLLDGQASGRLPRNGLQLDGFRFVGGFDLSNATVDKPLEITASSFSGDVLVRNAKVLGELQIARSVIRGRFLATGSTFEAKLLFTDNKLGGNLNLANSTFKGDITDLDETRAASVLMNGVTTQGTVPLSRARITGSIDLTAARIGRSLYLKDLASAGDVAPQVRLLGAEIGESLDLRGSDIGGGLLMTGTRITRDVVLAGARLGHAALDDAEIGGALELATTGDDAVRWTPEGSLDLRGSHVGTLVDNSRAWPSSCDGPPDRTRLAIGDLTYDNWRV
ncbi:MAG TPA: hypothetical protein VEG34_07650, partial [Thermoanaerobaculia bacterium]|nr:hypothetical protein [Thermoanaerobaculia bacterium]